MSINLGEIIDEIRDKNPGLSENEINYKAGRIYMEEHDREMRKVFDIPERTLTITDLKKKEPKKNPFVVEGMIVEGALNIVHGSTGCGKSMFILKMINDITLGQKFLDRFEVKAQRCLLIDLEMTEDDCIVRAREICDDNDSMMSIGKPFDVQKKEDMEWLLDFINTHDINLIAFDTLSKIHTADENSNTQMTPVMMRLLELCHHHNKTVIVLHHVNKSKDTSGLARGRGATCISDNAASYLEVSSKRKRSIIEPEKSYLLMTVSQKKSRRRESVNDFLINITYKEEDLRTYFTFLEEKFDVDPTTEIRPKLLEFIKENPNCNKAFIENSDICGAYSRSTIREAIAGLVAENKLKTTKQGRSVLYQIVKNDEENNSVDVMPVEKINWND